MPQGSVLGPIMFLVYVNDMMEGVESYICLFADDAKIMKKIKDTWSLEGLQKDLNKIYKWSQEWEMEFNAKKCKVVEMDRSKRKPSR